MLAPLTKRAIVIVSKLMGGGGVRFGIQISKREFHIHIYLN